MAQKTFEPAHDSTAGGTFAIDEVYTASPLVETHEVDTLLRNSDGEITGHTLRLKFPDGNANHPTPRFGNANPLLTRMMGEKYNQRQPAANREALAPMPTREESALATSRRLASRTRTNALQQSATPLARGDVQSGSRDDGPSTFKRGGHDMRTPRQRAGYVAATHRTARADSAVPLRNTAKLNPVERAPVRGAMALREPRTFTQQRARPFQRAQEEADSGRIGKAHLQHATSKRATTTPRTKLNTEVVVEKHAAERPKDETMGLYARDTVTLPSAHIGGERPVLTGIEVRNASHTLVDFMPEEDDQARVADLYGHITPIVSQRLEALPGDSRPDPARSYYREAEINTHKQHTLEKTFATGDYDHVTSRKMYDRESDRINGASIFDNSKGVGDLGADDALHTARDSDANIDGISKKRREQFGYETRMSIGGRGLVHTNAALLGKKEKFSSKRLPDREGVLGRAYPSHVPHMVGPEA